MKKTAVECFGSSSAQPPAFSFSGGALVVLDKFEYLGVLHNNSDGLAASLPMLLGKHSAALMTATNDAFFDIIPFNSLQAAESPGMRLSVYTPACRQPLRVPASFG